MSQTQVKSGVRKMQKTEVVLNPIQAEFYETAKIYGAKRLQLKIRAKKAAKETEEIRKKIRVQKAAIEKALDERNIDLFFELRKELKELIKERNEKAKEARKKFDVGKYLKETNEIWRKYVSLLYQLPDAPSELPPKSEL